MAEDTANYTELLEALTNDPYTIIVAVVKDGKLIDWEPADTYCTLKRAKLDNEWPEDAEISLVYALDALSFYFNSDSIG